MINSLTHTHTHTHTLTHTHTHTHTHTYLHTHTHALSHTHSLSLSHTHTHTHTHTHSLSLTHSLSCPSCSMMTLAPGVGGGWVQRRGRWCHFLWASSPILEPHTLPQMEQGKPDTRGVPATHWCLLMRLSDRRSWLIWCIWETAVAQVTCRVPEIRAAWGEYSLTFGCPWCSP